MIIEGIHTKILNGIFMMIILFLGIALIIEGGGDKDLIKIGVGALLICFLHIMRQFSILKGEGY